MTYWECPPKRLWDFDSRNQERLPQVLEFSVWDLSKALGKRKRYQKQNTESIPEIARFLLSPRLGRVPERKFDCPSMEELQQLQQKEFLSLWWIQLLDL